MGNCLPHPPTDPYNNNNTLSLPTPPNDTKNGIAFKSTPSLHKGLTRERKNQDATKIYDVLEIIGAGSMGSVSKIRKRPSRIGGSAYHPKQTNKSLFIGNGQLLQFFHFERFQKKMLRMEGNVNDDDDDDNDDGIDEDTGATTCSIFKSFSQLSDSLHSSLFGGHHRGDALDCSPHLSPPETTPPPPTTTTTTIKTRSRSSNKTSQNEIVYALKSIHLNRVCEIYLKELRNEIDILKSLDHPNIVRPIETYEYKRYLYMVMELCSGGDLYTRDPYTEQEAATIIGKILSAIAYIHEVGIIHRDLKYENIMFENSRPHAEVKLIDFGLSKKYLPGDPLMSESVGTIYTMAPEVMEGRYDSKIDIWSIGVVAFMLLSSQLPFYGNKRRLIIEKILKCDYSFDGQRWEAISNEAKEFVSTLLQRDPDKRPTASEALNHVFFTRPSLSGGGGREGDNDDDNKQQNAVSTCKSSSLDDNIPGLIRNYATYSKMKRLALMIVAYKSTNEELGILRQVFHEFDVDRDGRITFDDFQQKLEPRGYPKEDLERMFAAVDLDGTGSIKYTEFLAATIETQGLIEEERLAEAFDQLDSDDSGYITYENLYELFSGELSIDKIKEIIDEVDLTKNNKISYDEFLHIWDQRNEDTRVSIPPPLHRRSSNLSVMMKKRLSSLQESDGDSDGDLDC